jgi:hypothetical protein
MENSVLIPELSFLIGTLGWIGAISASYLMLNQVNQSRPTNEQTAWWDRSFLFKIWQSHRTMSPDSPLRKCVIICGLLMIVGWFGAFYHFVSASSANAR